MREYVYVNLERMEDARRRSQIEHWQPEDTADDRSMFAPRKFSDREGRKVQRWRSRSAIQRLIQKIG